MQLISKENIKSVSGGVHPVIAVVTVVGAYYTGREVGRSIRSWWNS